MGGRTGRWSERDRQAIDKVSGPWLVSLVSVGYTVCRLRALRYEYRRSSEGQTGRFCSTISMGVAMGDSGVEVGG